MNDTTFHGDGKIAYVPVVVDTKPKPITNADRIRSMTDEELAEFLNNTQGRAFGGTMLLHMQWLDWLKQEEKE